MVFTRRLSPTLWDDPDWADDWWSRPRWRWLRHKGWTRVSGPGQTWRVAVDVAAYRPDELDVRIVERDVVIKGSHPERRDRWELRSSSLYDPVWYGSDFSATEGGTVARSFTRRYPLPVDVRQDDVTATLSRDGVLLVSAPRFPATD